MGEMRRYIPRVSEVLGQVLAGRYRILAPIGRGGMGAVWRARDEELDRTVAIKELRLPEEIGERDRQIFYARMRREARAAARLRHPGIVTVHDRVTGDDGRPWIVMELVEGGSLQDLIAEQGRVPAGRAAEIGAKMLAALRAAHEQGIVHRDVKPANVLLEGDRVVVTDFGIATLDGDATLTGTGAILGTPAFMAPEQVRGEPATPESDLWSLGATLYAAVEGRPPFDGPTTGSIFVAIATEDPSTCVHAGPLTAVIEGLLRKDPAHRLTPDQTAVLLAPPGRPSPEPASAPPAPAAAGSAHPDFAPAPTVAQPGVDGSPPPPRFAPGYARPPAGPPYGPPAGAPYGPGGQRPTVERRALLFGGLAAAGAAVIGVPAWLLWPEGRKRHAGSPVRSAPPSAPPSPTSTPTRTAHAVFKAHEQFVDSVAFSPDGQTLAGGVEVGVDGHPNTMIQLWKVPSGHSTAGFKVSTRNVPLVAFRPDGKGLLGADEDGAVRLWDLASRKSRVAVPKSHKRPGGTAMSPDGLTVARSEGEKVLLWDVASGRLVRTFTGHTYPVRGVAFSRDGRALAGCSPSDTIRIWDVATGHTVRTIPSPAYAPQSNLLAFSPDGRILAAVTEDNVQLWDVAGSRLTKSLEHRIDGRVDEPYSLAFSPDGKTLATGNTSSLDKGDVLLWDVATGNNIMIFKGHRGTVWSVAFSPDGKTLASGSSDKTVRLWDVPR